MNKKNKKLMVIDGNALIHRSFHAIPPTITTKDGVIVNAVYGFSSFLLRAILEFNPEYLVLTLDRKAPTFRHKEYVEYKATRTKAPDELYAQIPLVREIAKAFNMPIFELDGFEADDLIGTIVSRSEQETDFENYIITGDMDSLQLVTAKTKVYAMSRGLNESVTYTEDRVFERYSLKPNQIVDYKALRGDPSDNIPGVKGIGEKTATELLQNFKTLDGVYQASDNNSTLIKPRINNLLQENRDNAYLSQSLATIKCDVNLKINWEEMLLDDFDLEKAIEIFSKFEFKSLIPKLKELKKDFSEEKISKENSYENKFTRNKKEKKYLLINTEDDFQDLLKLLKKQKSLAFDTETSGLDAINCDLLGISFCFKDNEAYYLNLAQGKKKVSLDLFTYNEAKQETNSWLQELKSVLENENIKKYGHNIKFDLRVLKNQGVDVKGLSFDTMIASYLLHPDNRQHGLDIVSLRELSWEKISTSEIIGQGKDKISFLQVDLEKITQYAGEDADCVWQLVKKLEPQIKEEGLEELMTKIEMPLIKVLAEMEENGISVSPDRLKELEQDLSIRLKDLSLKIYQEAQEEFNINSPKQLQVILFDKLELPIKGLKKTKTGISTADEELAKLVEAHSIIPLIRAYRELNKLQSTYVLSLVELINKKTSRIHTSYNQTITATGRLSSTEPNLQNIPARSEDGQKIRSAFVAKKDNKLLSLDYSQIELRLAAHLSQDQNMIQAFNNKEDIHSATAAKINNVSLLEVTKNMRYEAKAINFGILYGQGPHGLAQNANIDYKQAQEFINKYFEVYPQVKEMIDNSIKVATEKGFALTMFNRKRYLPNLLSENVMIHRSAERMAINTPIQGSAADLIKIAMIKVYQEIKEHGNEIKMLLQIHDELIFEVIQEKAAYWQDKIKNIMEHSLKISVPIIVDYEIGDNWGELK